MMTREEDHRARQAIRVRATELVARLEELNAIPKAARTSDHVAESEAIASEVDDMEERAKPIDERIALRARTGDLKNYDVPHPVGYDRGRTSGESSVLRTIDLHRDVLSARAGDNLQEIVRQRDPLGLEGRYIEAVAAPAYDSAFGKLLADPRQGHLRFSPEESTAVSAVSQAQAARAALAVGTDSLGGFALPLGLDPTILISSSGAVNPVREFARVFSITTSKWQGVSADAVSASYDAEGSEVSDDAPTLAAPKLKPAMGRAFIPFSIELGMDWLGAREELTRLIVEGRDILDASEFLTGTGTDAPLGILTVGTTGALTTAQRVQTDTARVLDIDDVWDIKGQVGSTGFASDARWAAHPSTFDAIFRMTPSGSTSEPQAMPTREGPLCGIEKFEWSTMATATTTTGSKVAIVGDWSRFFIGDRLGMTVEMVPHLFDTANNRPSGERGILAYWRTGTTVVTPNAFKYLEVK